jgi:hypothetical protein
MVHYGKDDVRIGINKGILMKKYIVCEGALR